MPYDPAAALAALAPRAPRKPAADRPQPGKRYALSALVPTRDNPAPTWADAEVVEPQPDPEAARVRAAAQGTGPAALRALLARGEAAAAPQPNPEPQPAPAEPDPIPEGWDVIEAENRRGTFYLVTGPRLDRSAWAATVARARAAGGWYSRRWGASPAGYGFPDRASAEGFAASEGGAS